MYIITLIHLENHEVPFDKQLREKFQSDAYCVYQLLTENRRDFLQYEYEEYQRIRKENFKAYFVDFSVSDIKRFIDLCMEIGNNAKQNREELEVISSFVTGLNILAKTRQDLFEIALKYYLQQGDQLNLSPIHLVRTFLVIHGKEQTFAFLNDLNYPTKNRWLFSYYQMLSSDKIDAKVLLSLLELFKKLNVLIYHHLWIFC